jgi:hypothetical protein
MRHAISRLVLLVLSLSTLTGCGNEEQGSVSAPVTVATITVSPSDVPPTVPPSTPPSTVITVATATTQLGPTSVVATTIAAQPSVTAAIDPTPEAQKASVIFFSAPN